MSYDVTRSLQNSLGSRAYPTNRAFGSPDLDAIRKRRAIGLALAVLGLTVAAIGWGVRSSPNGASLGPFPLGIALVGVAALLKGLTMLPSPATQERKNQRRYYTLGNVPALDDRQRTALALGAFQIYHVGAWTETLGFFPATRRFLDAGIETPRFWQFADLKTPDEALRDLDADWGIVSREGFDKTVDQLFDGLHCRVYRVAFDLDAESAGVFRERLVGLVGKDEAYVMAQLAPRGARPPALLWAFDLWRVIPMSRSAFMANLVTEEEAWAHILRASEWVHALFETPEAYFENLRLGHAFWSMELAEVQTFRDMVEGWQTATEFRWPQHDLPWLATHVDFPADVGDGFHDAVRRESPDGPVPGRIGFN